MAALKLKEFGGDFDPVTPTGPDGVKDPLRYVKLGRQGGALDQIKAFYDMALAGGDTKVVNPFVVESAPAAPAPAPAPTAPAPISLADIESLIAAAFRDQVATPVPDPTFDDSDGQPVAAGLEAMIEQFKMLMMATEQGRLQQGQNLEFASFFSNLARTDPVTAANLQFGITGEPINPFGAFAQSLAQGKAPLSFGGLPSTLPISVGGTNLDLGTSLTGGQLSSLSQNPAALRIIQGLQELAGVDILGQSRRALIPGGVLPSAAI
jgi:hypothetical protein